MDVTLLFVGQLPKSKGEKKKSLTAEAPFVCW